MSSPETSESMVPAVDEPVPTGRSRKTAMRRIAGAVVAIVTIVAVFAFLLPRIADYRKHVLAIADALRGLEGVDIVPDPPQTTMMHLVFRRPREELVATALRIAREDGIWVNGYFADTGAPGVARAEFETGDATMEFSPEEYRSVIERLVAG